MSTQYIQVPSYGSPSWKAPVANVAALPATGNSIGDARVTKDTSSIYVWNGSSWVLVGGGGGSGTVTSVGLSMPSIFSVSGSPVTTSGTLTATLTTETANRVFAGPTTGSPATPTFRALVAADIPAGLAPAGSNGTFQYNNAGVFGGVPTVFFLASNPYSTGFFGFNNTTPTHPVDIASSFTTLLPPATVTITASDVDPANVGVCTSSFDGAPEKQYDNNSTSCTTNGVCIGGSGGETDPVTCANDGGTWYFNTFTVTAGYVMPTNGTTIEYTLHSYNASLNFYSPTSTSQFFVTNFDTDPTSFLATQNEAESGYTANGTTYTYTIYAVYGSNLRSFGSSGLTATDNNDGNPYAWDITFDVPLTGSPTQYYVYNTTTGNAQYTATNSITDDGSWPPFVDPGISGVEYNVSWSSVAGASSYHITGPLGFYAFYPTTSFLDTGIPYYNNSSPNPVGPVVSVPGLFSNGITLLKNTLSPADATLQVWAPSPGQYSQQWFSSTGALASYMDSAGTFTGNFNSISGNQQLGGTLTAGTVNATNYQNHGNGSFEIISSDNTNNFFRVSDASASSSALVNNILYFDSNVTSGTPAAGFGGGIQFRSTTTTTPQIAAAGVYGGFGTTTNASYLGRMQLGVFDHNNTSTPIVGVQLDSNGTGVALTLGVPSTTVQHTLNTSVATNASGSGTFTNLPAGYSGNPTGYIQITINGGTHVIPYW